MKSLCLLPIISFCIILSSGCMNSLEEAMPERPNDFAEAVVVNGRIFYYLEPLSFPPPGGYPVVICFHGGDGYAIQWVSLGGNNVSGFGTLAYRGGYFVIAPESGVSDDPSGSLNDVKKRWDTSVESKDIPFIIDIIAWLADSGYYVDFTRIFGVGISSGGGMVSRLAQSVPSMFNRVAIVASINPSYGYFDVPQTVSSSHPSALFVHGTADPLTPYDIMLNYYTAIPHTEESDTLSWGNEPIKYLFTVVGGSHTWFSDYDDEILLWFDSAP